MAKKQALLRLLEPTRPDVPAPLLRHTDELGAFVHGLQWSPDGLCVLAALSDASVRLYEVGIDPTGVSAGDVAFVDALRVRTGEHVLDVQWYPLMHSSAPATCAFVTAARDHPVQLWDAFTAKRRCAYAAMDGDMPAATYALAFDPDGTVCVL